jgi:hypothetical protein
LTWTVAVSLLAGDPSVAGAGAEHLIPGTSYFGRNNYIEYIAGDLPLVLSVPHGGSLMPAELPDREQAVAVADTWSIEYTLAVADIVYQLTGHHPHVVINHLQRVKLDANRDLAYGAQDSPAAQQAWHEFNDFIDLAEDSAVEQCGRGLFLDLHSNGQAGGWIQLGYGIPATDLVLSNEELDRPAHVAESSLRSLSTISGEGLSSLLRGPDSLGGLLEARGYRAVPSNIVPWPPGILYYDGGYNVFHHGSRNGGGVDGIQIETSIDYVRPENMHAYASVLGEAILSFMEMHYGFSLDEGAGTICPTFADVQPGEQSSAAIEGLYKEGVLQPCSSSPRLFCPGEPLTRGDAAEMIGRVIQPVLPATDAMGAIYQDIPSDDPLAPWASTMWQAGLGASCREDRLAFCPDEGFSRAEAARTFLQLLKGPSYLPPPPTGVFSDLSVDDWRTWWAEAAYDEGLMQPCADVTSLQFCPDEALSRGQAAVLLATVADARTSETYAGGEGISNAFGKSIGRR